MYLTELLTASAPRSSLKDRAKIVLGAAIYPKQTKRWKSYVEQHALLRDLAPLHPQIVHKIYRPFLSNHLACEARVDILMNHYRRVADMGLAQLVRRAALAPVTLAEISGRSGNIIALRLAAINVAHREGELALQLVFDRRTVYTLGFTFFDSAGYPQLALGCLQGLSSPDGAAVVRQLTRELFGLRPKNFMMAAFRQLGLALGCYSLMLVSNRNRVVVNWRRANRISCDYDATWRELNATPLANGNFELPCEAPTRNIESVPSHKRSEVRKRHTMMALAGQSLKATLERYGVSAKAEMAKAA